MTEICSVLCFLLDRFVLVLILTDSSAEMKQKIEKEKGFIGAMLPSQRYWTKFNVEKNPYTHIRLSRKFCFVAAVGFFINDCSIEAFPKWAKRDLRTLSNEDYQNQKFNTLARMNATVKIREIFPDVLDKFTPTINLLAEYNDPIARDILVYYGNVIPARFVCILVLLI